MDDSKMTYRPGNIVWVRLLNRIWWPGKVVSINNTPSDFSESLNKKKPIIAIVYFEREDVYEVVYNKNKLFMYSCLRKMEFVKKGLVMYKKQTNGVAVPCNFIMINFIRDVVQIEREIYGDVNIFVPIEQDYDAEHPKTRPRELIETYALFMTEKQRRIIHKKEEKQNKILEQIAIASKSRKKKSKKTVAKKTKKTTKVKKTAKSTKVA